MLRPGPRHRTKPALLFALCLLFAATGATRDYDPNWKQHASRRPNVPASLAVRPVVKYLAHTRGMLQMAIANNGTFGTYGQDIVDPNTGLRIPSCTYPPNSDHVYLWVGAFWIGAVVGRDTLVSTGTEDFYVNQEFWPDPEPFGDFDIRSIDINSPYYSTEAYSEEDLTCEYTDTFTDPGLVSSDQILLRPHRPLGIKITQRSMAWSYSYADDFILFDYLIQNIGTEILRQVYMGIWIDGDVWHVSRNGPEGWNDDIVGFLFSHPAPEGCGFIDTVRIAYTADNDADPDGGAWDYRSPRNVVGARVVRTPSDSLDISFNWWITNYGSTSADFGPRKKGTPDDPWRDFVNGRLGTPEGDRDKYYILRHQEFDYDLLKTAVNHEDSGFKAPPEDADVYARGYDARYLLSFGPFNINPGAKLPISFAWVGGADFHTDPSAFATVFTPDDPEPFYEYLNFADYALNARWASWVYDNPGYDTDDDGYAGKFRVCAYDSTRVIDTVSVDPDTLIDTTYEYTLADTFYYEGDGVPDFRGAGPPPAPRMRIVPSLGKLTVRWNGFFSETTPDVFIGKVDFEGYRVYAGRDDRIGSLSLLRSYDREDYNRYEMKTLPNGQYGWVLEDTPFTLAELRGLYGPEFDPSEYTRVHPFVDNGRYFYFDPQDYNASDLSSQNGIHKVFPESINPGLDTSLWQAEDLVFDYGRPLPKFYEYEFVLDDILPTVPYYVAVTAFDFGSPGAGLTALETSPLSNMIMEYPLTASDSAAAEGSGAYVYPNPYVDDGDYAARGYENRDRSLAPDRARRIHFANLPHQCTITVYSLDGDLIRQWEHDYPEGGPGSMHDSWDLISRNTQAVVSGIYYWTVQDRQGNSQIGKLVIIR